MSNPEKPAANEDDSVDTDPTAGDDSDSVDTDPTAGDDPARIQLIVNRGSDRAALADLLDDRYTVVVDDDLQAVDGYLIGDRMLPAYREAIRALKADRHPEFCPVLVISRPERAKTVADLLEAPEDPRPLVDEVVTAPVDRPTLYRRFRNLLVRRRQSLELAERIDTTERRFQQLFDSTNDALFVLEESGESFLDCNPAACELTGYDPETLCSMSPAGLFDHEDSGCFQAFVEEVQHTDSGWTNELTCLRSDGEVRLLEVSAGTLEASERPPVVFSARDITERKEREHQLRLFGKAVENVQQSVVITERSGEIIHVNPAFEAETGYTAAEVKGRTPRVLKSGKHDEAFYSTLWETILSGESWESDLINQRKSGELHWVHQSISPITDDGEITHFVAIKQDVTDRRLREQQLSVLNRLLRHNLRNGMNVIKGNAELLEKSLSTDLQRFLAPIETRAEALTQLSQKVGTVQSLFEGEHTAADVCVLEPLFETITREFHERYPTATLEVVLEGPLVVRADSRLELALLELLDNSVVHNDSPEPAVTLIARPSTGERAAEWVEIVICDNGPGIPEHEQQVIESGAETPLQHGTGLGLWLAYWTVSLCGGEIQIDNEESGTRVRLLLPRADPETAVEADTDTE